MLNVVETSKKANKNIIPNLISPIKLPKLGKCKYKLVETISMM